MHTSYTYVVAIATYTILLLTHIIIQVIIVAKVANYNVDKTSYSYS